MSFDRRLGELLDYEDAGRPGIDPALVIRRARRRRSRRTVAAAAAATLVIAVSAAVTVDLTGSGDRRPALTVAAPTSGTTTASPSPMASPSATRAVEPSPVRAVAPGERFTVHGGMEMWVTATEECTSEQTPGFAPRTACRDSDSDTVQGPTADGRDQKPMLGGQSSQHTGQPMLYTGIYLGRTAPARIVATGRGEQALATIVTTPGMDGWVAFYVILPGSMLETPPPTPQPHASRTGLVLTAYDAGGNPLAETPPTTF